MNDPAGPEKSGLISFYDYVHAAIRVFDPYHIRISILQNQLMLLEQVWQVR